MNAVLIDSNVLLDVLVEDPVWGAWSEAALADCANSSLLVINPIIYAEVSVGFARVEDVEIALPPTAFQRVPLPFEAAFLAGKSFLAYRRRGGLRRTPLPDFYIGAHAAVTGMALLTRDATRFKTSFPTVRLIAP